MISELNDRQNKLKSEITENQKNPERIATSKGKIYKIWKISKKETKKLKMN